MFKHFIRYSDLVKPSLLFLLFCIIYYIQNRLYLPLNGGDLNFPYATATHLNGVFSTFNYRAFFGFENSREISSLVYAIIIHALSFFFENNYLITNFIIVSGVFTSLICTYLYLKKFNLNQNNSILISFFWILNPVFIFIFSQIYYGANIYVYLFLFFDVLIICKIIESDKIYLKFFFLVIYYFSPTNISFNNPALFITYIPAVIFLLSLLYQFKLKNLIEIIIIITFANLIHIYAIYNLIFGATINEASNELFIANSNVQVMKESMAGFFDALSFRGLWVTTGRIFQDFYNPYFYIFISPVYIVTTYLPFIALITFCIKYLFTHDKFINNTNIPYQKFTYILICFFLFVYVNSLHTQVINIINLISPGIVQAFRSGMQKLGFLIVIAYFPILIYTIRIKQVRFLIIIFLISNILILLAGNIYKHSFLQWPGSYFEVPKDYLELTKNKDLNEINTRYLSLPYNSDPNIELTKEEFSYSGSDFKFNLLNSSNIMHGDNRFFIDYSKYIFGNKDIKNIKNLMNYFNINYIFNHHDLSPISIGIHPNGLRSDSSYLRDFDLLIKNNYFELYKTNEKKNFFSIKSKLSKIKNFTGINNLDKNYLYVNAKSNLKDFEISNNIPNLQEVYDISSLTANISIKFSELANQNNFILHMTHRFSNYWKLQIENINNLGLSDDYFYHSNDVFGLNYWVFDIKKYCKFNDCNDDQSLKIKIYYENFYYLKMLIIFLSFFGSIIFYLSKKLLLKNKVIKI